MPAVSIATSVPVAMAIPTSAAARAGASLMPSPTIATTLPAWRSAATAAALSCGRMLACTASMPIAVATGLCGPGAVAGEHHSADAQAMQSGDRGPCARLGCVAECHQRQGRAVLRQPRHGVAGLLQRRGLGGQRRRVHPRLRHQPGVAEHRRVSTHDARDAAPRQVAEGFDRRQPSRLPCAPTPVRRSREDARLPAAGRRRGGAPCLGPRPRCR